MFCLKKIISYISLYKPILIKIHVTVIDKYQANDIGQLLIN